MKEEEKRKKYFRLDRSCLIDEYTLAVYSASYARHTFSFFHSFDTGRDEYFKVRFYFRRAVPLDCMHLP